MTTKILLAVLVLASARTALADECLAWPFDPAPVITQHFHDARPGFNRNHTGVDVDLPAGTVLKAIGDGRVTQAGHRPDGTNVVEVRFGAYVIHLGHLKYVSVEAGQAVRYPTLLGESGGAVGADGSGPNTTGPHLHLTVLRNGQLVDPETVFCK